MGCSPSLGNDGASLSGRCQTWVCDLLWLMTVSERDTGHAYTEAYATASFFHLFSLYFGKTDRGCSILLRYKWWTSPAMGRR